MGRSPGEEEFDAQLAAWRQFGENWEFSARNSKIFENWGGGKFRNSNNTVSFAVLDLIYWRDPKKSGIALAAILAVLFIFTR